jgi:drug/metabolite transporter (DMT)-like permease
MAIALAISAAACWGLADFLAGLASRRVAVPIVLLLVQLGGLVVVLTYALLAGAPFFRDGTDVVSSLAGGLSGVVALGCLYRALAIGTMSVVAPISAAGVALPVAVGVATGDHPSAVAAAGLAAIVVGVVLASREGHTDAATKATSRTSVLLALAAAVGFGGWFALTDAPVDTSVPWTLVLARSAALPLVAATAWRSRPPLPPRSIALGLAAVGTIDLLATALVGMANTKGALSVVSVLGSMYPMATVVLAAIVLHERLRPPQMLGIALALGGVAAVAGT